MSSLKPNDAVGALLIADGKILLQLRDNKPDIFFPNMWGVFGGGVEPGETPEQALVRELHEELGTDFSQAKIDYFTEFTFDFTSWGYGTVYRKYFLVDGSNHRLESFVLGEGRQLGYFDLQQISTMTLTPYDAFAVWIYKMRKV